jgi:uncharacterized membrane protein
MTILAALLTAIYPVLIYYGLSKFEPRVLALLLVFTALLRWRGGRLALAGLGWEGRVALVAPVVLAVATGIGNKEITLKLYPVAVNIALLAAFCATLFSGESMVERIARIRHKDLDVSGIRYTRRVTQVWCAFFAVNGSVSAWTAIQASRETWALYNGFLAYLAMAAVFSIEWFCRKRMAPKKDRVDLEPQ